MTSPDDTNPSDADNADDFPTGRGLADIDENSMPSDLREQVSDDIPEHEPTEDDAEPNKADLNQP